MFTKEAIVLLKKVKVEKGYTNEFISEQTGVAKGTVDRVFGNKDYNFSYDTLSPIYEFLIGKDLFSISSESPLTDNELVEFLKSDILQLKERMAEEKTEHKEQVAELKTELKLQREEANARLQQLEASYREQITSIEQKNSKEKNFYKVGFFSLIVIIIALVLFDLSMSSVGWFQELMIF